MNTKLKELKEVQEKLKDKDLGLFEKMELKDLELDLKRELNLIIRPEDPEDCESCSA